MEEFITLNKSGVLKIGIKDYEGNPTGEYLEFDMEDIELPIIINNSDIEHKKNLQKLKADFVIIEKKQDKKGKKLLSFKEEEKIKAMNEFYKKEMEVLDSFLGKDGTKKLLNGRKPYWTMYDDILDYLQPIMPKLKQNTDDIIGRIKNKYSAQESDVLE